MRYPHAENLIFVSVSKPQPLRFAGLSSGDRFNLLWGAVTPKWQITSKKSQIKV
jgi:hypothetical protein